MDSDCDYNLNTSDEESEEEQQGEEEKKEITFKVCCEVFTLLFRFDHFDLF